MLQIFFLTTLNLLTCSLLIVCYSFASVVNKHLNDIQPQIKPPQTSALPPLELKDTSHITPNPMTISTFDKLKVDTKEGQLCQPFFNRPIIMNQLSL
jgi:hypothetical protein